MGRSPEPALGVEDLGQHDLADVAVSRNGHQAEPAQTAPSATQVQGLPAVHCAYERLWPFLQHQCPRGPNPPGHHSDQRSNLYAAELLHNNQVMHRHADED